MTSLIETSDQLRCEGFAILQCDQKFRLHEFARQLSDLFPKSAGFYCDLAREDFHSLIEIGQASLNDSGALNNFVSSHSGIISELIGTDLLSWVSVMKLRGVRPKRLLPTGTQDNVNLHRESLYASHRQVSFQYNCWIPLSAAASVAGMWYIPRSHIVPDAELIVTNDFDSPVRVERFSSGHRIGLPYNPKSIDQSPVVKNGQRKKFLVPSGSFIIFSSMLIHGGGVNDSSEIRFSMDSGVLPTCRIEHNPELFAARGRNHYQPTCDFT